jgi:hexosaminidase
VEWNASALMPWPQEINVSLGKHKLTQDFCIAVPEGADKRLFDYTNRFLRRIDGRTGIFFTQSIISENHPQRPAFPVMQINVSRKGALHLFENETYSLSVKVDKIILEAETDLGIMHGLETLSQLLSSDEYGYYFPLVEIKDAPRFPWRGLMIDVSSHFIAEDVLKRNIDALAMVKMNVLHLHLSDDQGWRIESKLFPKLHQLASDGQFYTQAQIKDIVQYASDRGIRIIPEINLPHRATALLIAYPEFSLGTPPLELKRTGVTHPTILNIASEKTYLFLEKLLPEIANLFQDNYFHLGGDFNDYQTLMIGNNDFLKKNGLYTSNALQLYFTNRIGKALKKSAKKLIAWDEMKVDDLDKSTILQSKNDKTAIYTNAMEGYQTLLSYGYELDQMLPAQTHYTNDPLPPFEIHTDKDKRNSLTALQEKSILGAAVMMWSDVVNSASLDARLWPRTAAIAERLWSPASLNDIAGMYKRLDKVSILLEETNVTHLSNPRSIVQLLSNQVDIKPVEVLLGVMEPYKYHVRNQKGQMYKTYAPLSLLTDAAVVDAYDARIFGNYIHSFSHSRSAADKLEIDKYLKKWRDNHDDFIRISLTVPALKSLLKMSENVSNLAIVGLDALKHIETKITVQKSWYEANNVIISDIRKAQEANKLAAFSQNDARCELAIIEAIQQLLDMTNVDMAKKRMETKINKESK